MDRLKRVVYISKILLILLSLSLLGVSCANKTYLSIRYQMPMAEHTIAGKAIHLKVVDQREKKGVLSEEARSKAKYEREAFRLALASSEEPEKSLGTMDIPSIFREAMIHKAEQLGYTVRQEAGKDIPTLTLQMKTVQVDFVQKKWTAKIDYTLSMQRNVSRSADQSVRAEGERRRIRGTKELETLLGEVFSDAINRADITDLMERVGLK
jgi:hypothetical protein